MSSESPRARVRDAFTRRLLGTIVVLAVIAGGFAFASVVQGPRLSAAKVDAQRATMLAGQQLVIEVNQPVASFDADDVSVEPAASVSAVADDRLITVTFDEPLDYASEYTVRVPGVVGAFQGVPATLEYSFETPDEQVYSLVRRSLDGEPDLIQRKSFTEPGGEIVFTAPRIQEFAHAGEVVAAVTIDDAGANELFVADVEQDVPQEIALPMGAVVRDLEASTTNPLIGYLVSTPPVDGVRAQDSALYIADLTGAAGGPPQPVVGLDGEPIKVASWTFVPGTTAVVVQDFEQSVFLVDAFGSAPVTPLGVHSEVRGFVPGTSRLVVADPDRGSMIDLTDGTTTTVDLPLPSLGDADYPGRLTMTGDDRYVLSVVTVVVQPDGSTSIASRLAEVDATETRDVFTPASEGSIIREYCISPNGRYAAVTTSDAQGRPDGYAGLPGYTESTMSIVDLSNGAVEFSQSGGFSDWCSI